MWVDALAPKRVEDSARGGQLAVREKMQSAAAGARDGVGGNAAFVPFATFCGPKDFGHSRSARRSLGDTQARGRPEVGRLLAAGIDHEALEHHAGVDHPHLQRVPAGRERLLR